MARLHARVSCLAYFSPPLLLPEWRRQLRHVSLATAVLVYVKEHGLTASVRYSRAQRAPLHCGAHAA